MLSNSGCVAAQFEGHVHHHEPLPCNSNMLAKCFGCASVGLQLTCETALACHMLNSNIVLQPLSVALLRDTVQEDQKAAADKLQRAVEKLSESFWKVRIQIRLPFVM